MDLSRRALFRGRFTSNPIQQAPSVRMPWMVSSELFTDQCSRCAECIDACPEGIIEKGDGGFPTVNFNQGECTFCTECVEVCQEPVFRSTEETPWDWIAQISENNQGSGVQGGMAVSLDGVCMAHQGVVCQSCKDVCDVRAIRMHYQISAVATPVIDQDACTGCGACVSVCPTKAIDMQLPATTSSLTNNPNSEE